jgi:hypothetical protein
MSKFLVEFLGKGYEKKTTIDSQDVKTARDWADTQLAMWCRDPKNKLPKKIRINVTPVLS